MNTTTRASGIDKFHGLKGAAYIRARGLTAQPNHNAGVTSCAHCAHHEMLPAVQRILAAQQQRAA